MMATFFPSIGSWYQELATGQLFEVVAFDDKSNSVEIQYEDGDIAEYDLESWHHLDISMAAEPTFGLEACDGGFDAESEQDLYNSPLNEIEGDSYFDYDEPL